MSSDHEFSITHEAGTMVLEANRLLAEEELKGTEVIRKPALPHKVWVVGVANRGF